MRFDTLQENWEKFAAADPLHAVLTDRSRSTEEVLELGREDVRRIVSRARAHGLNVGGARALDFGCGVGRLTQALADYFSTVVGVDIAAAMITAAEANNTFPGRVTFVQNSTSDLAMFPDESFDFVLSLLVLQHLRPELSLGYLSEFLRVLRPGGVAVFQVPTQRARRRGRYALIRSFPMLVGAYRRLRYGPAPDREMYVIPPALIAATVTRSRGEIVAVERDDSAGPDFESAIYFVVRHAPAKSSVGWSESRGA